MKPIYKTTAALAALVSLAGCVSPPKGPAVMSLPGTGKTQEQFASDHALCMQTAREATGGEPAAQSKAADSAVVGTVVGAAAGALIGSASGKAGAGAAIGAGAGLLVGSAAGSNAGSYSLQQTYDIIYSQCMYGKGHQVQTQGQTTGYVYYPGGYYYTSPAPTVYQVPAPAPAPAAAPAAPARAMPMPPPPPGYNGPPPVYRGPPPGAN